MPLRAHSVPIIALRTENFSTCQLVVEYFAEVIRQMPNLWKPIDRSRSMRGKFSTILSLIMILRYVLALSVRCNFNYTQYGLQGTP